MSYSKLFNETGISIIRLGQADSYSISIAILVKQEKLSSDDNTFTRIVLQELNDQFNLIKRFSKMIEQYIKKPYIYHFINGPMHYTYDPHEQNHISINRVSLTDLVHTLVNRVDYATRRLFYLNNPKEWNPNSVMFNNQSSPDLIAFASQVLEFWNSITPKFSQLFSDVIDNATQKYKAEKNKKFKHHEEDNSVKQETIEPRVIITKPIEDTTVNEWHQRTDELKTDVLKTEESKADELKTEELKTEELKTENKIKEKPKKIKKDKEEWTKIQKKDLIDLDISMKINGKKSIMRAKILPDGTIKQIQNK